MQQIKVLDIAFSAIPDVGWVERRKAEGVEVIFQNVWTGGYLNNPQLQVVAAPNLEKIYLGKCVPGIYTNASPWRLPTVWFNESRTNMGGMAPFIKHVMVDIEIQDGDMYISPEYVMEYIQMWENTGRKVCTYSADWFVGFWKLLLGDANRVYNGRPYVHARYDGVADVNVSPPIHPLGPLMGKQYLGSHTIEGVDVDASVMDAAFFEIGDSMAISAKAEAGIEAFFATPYTDRYGNLHDNFAQYLMQTTAYLDKDHIENIYAALGVFWNPDGTPNVENLRQKLDELDAYTRNLARFGLSGGLSTELRQMLEDILTEVQNPPLGSIAQSVRDKFAAQPIK